MLAVLVLLALAIPPLPPSVPLAIAVYDPFGYRVVVGYNGTVTVAYGSPLRLRVSGNETEVTLTSTTGNSISKTFLEPGRHAVANLTDPGTRVLTAKANGTELIVTISVLSPAETARYQASKSASVDPRRVKFIYAIVSTIAFSIAGVEIGYRLKSKRISKVEEL